MKEDIQPWRQKMMAYYLPHKSKSWHHPVKAATTKLDQKAISPTKTCGFLIQICENPDLISQNSNHRNLLRTSMYKTQKDHQQRSYHPPPQSCDDSWPSPSNIYKSPHNFRKLTTPGSSMALDLQDLKISSQEA